MSTAKATGYVCGPVTTNSHFGYHLGRSRWKKRSRFKASGRTMLTADVKNLLKTTFDGRLAREDAVYGLDGRVYLPTLREAIAILADSRVSRMDYNTEQFDCDDFAFGVKGEFSLFAYSEPELLCSVAFGVISGEFLWEEGDHVACFSVLANDEGQPEIRLVEPKKYTEASSGMRDWMHTAEQFRGHDQCRSCELILF